MYYGGKNMIIYIMYFLIIISLAITFHKNKKVFCIITGIMLWLLLALRSINIGINDTKNIYMPMFNNMVNITIIDIFKDKNMQDFLFWISMKIISVITSNFQICIAILAIPYIFFVMKTIYKYSQDCLISVILFMALYYMYSTFLLRQVIAVGILIMSYKYIVEQDIKKFILCLVVATLFHRTALIFLVAYPFCKYNKFDYKNYIYIFGMLVISKFFINDILELLMKFDFTNKVEMAITHNIYTVNGQISYFGLFITVAILFISRTFGKGLKEKKEFDTLCNLSTLGSAIFTLSNVVVEFYRVSVYFSIFNILLLPMALNNMKDQRTRIIFKTLVIIFAIIYFCTRTVNNVNSNPYMFWWEV